MISAPSNTLHSAQPNTLGYAQEALSGKRIALVGFSKATASELTEIIHEANAFTRSFPFQTSPSADVLKPFELIAIDIEQAGDTPWLAPIELSAASDRAVAVGSAPALLGLIHQPGLSFAQFCTWPVSADELLLRCVLAMHAGLHTGSRPLPNGSTVVLADDDPSITALVRLTLQRNGMTCEVASEGGTALELIQRLKPCAAILDVGMPNIDGFQVLARTRSIPELAQTRIILLTGCEQETDILRGFSLGADDYVIKPFNPMELMMRLKRAIGRI